MTTPIYQYLFNDSGEDSQGNNNLTGYNVSYESTPSGLNCGGKVAVFNGTNAYFQSNAVAPVFTGNFTIAAWVSIDTSNTFNPIVSGGTYAANQWLCFAQERQKLIFSFYSDAWYFDDFSDSNWHFIVVSWNKNTRLQSAYLDGQFVGTYTRSAATSVTNSVFYVGRRQNNGYLSYLSGKVANLRIYDTVLTAAGITALYKKDTMANQAAALLPMI